VRDVDSYNLGVCGVVRFSKLLSLSLIATTAPGMDSQYYSLSPPTLPKSQSDQESSRQPCECKFNRFYSNVLPCDEKSGLNKSA
jgi:hypothetical protein